MDQSRFNQLLDDLLTEELSPADHAELQEHLKSNATARELYRERMDLETSLRTWTAEAQTPIAPDSRTSGNRPSTPTRWQWIAGAIAIAALLAILTWPHQEPAPSRSTPTAGDSKRTNAPLVAATPVGVLTQQADCEWTDALNLNVGRFGLGRFVLTTGVAQLSFDSGTDVVMEAPCELEITSNDSATLIAGNVCVNVTEVSNGFILDTPESQIIDEGTEYAVAIEEDSTEVHVFDGSVLWVATSANAKMEDRIAAGEAKRYERANPRLATRIPFGARQFVRRLEAEIKEQAGDTLLAYDGFENLAGRTRRGRSGFGWSGGWQTTGRRRGNAGTIIDAPADTVFGIDRKGRRLLELRNSDDIRRDLAEPVSTANDGDIYVGLLAHRVSPPGTVGMLQISLEPNLRGRGRTRHRIASFGVTNDGFPFINSGGNVVETATVLTDEPHFFVFNLQISNGSVKPRFRVYSSHEELDPIATMTSTVEGRSTEIHRDIQSIRLKCGTTSKWQIDELRIGTTWDAVTR